MQRASAIGYAQGSIPAVGGGASAYQNIGTPAYGGRDYDPEDTRICTAEKKDGKRCKAFAVDGGTLCIGHRNRAEKLAREKDDV